MIRINVKEYSFVKEILKIRTVRMAETEKRIKKLTPLQFHLFNQTHLVCFTFALEIENQSFSAPQRESHQSVCGKRKLEKYSDKGEWQLA